MYWFKIQLCYIHKLIKLFLVWDFFITSILKEMNVQQDPIQENILLPYDRSYFPVVWDLFIILREWEEKLAQNRTTSHSGRYTCTLCYYDRSKFFLVWDFFIWSTYITENIFGICQYSFFILLEEKAIFPVDPGSIVRQKPFLDNFWSSAK